MRTVHGGRGYDGATGYAAEQDAWLKHLVKIAEREDWGNFVKGEGVTEPVVLPGDRTPTMFQFVVYRFERGQGVWHLPHPQLPHD